MIIGALLAGGSQYLLLRRRERSEYKVAQRLVTHELEEIRQLLGSAGAAGFTSATYSVDAFVGYKAVLARELSAYEWGRIAEAYGLLASQKEVSGFDPGLRLTLGRDPAQNLATIDDAIADAIDTLNPLPDGARLRRILRGA